MQVLNKILKVAMFPTGIYVLSVAATDKFSLGNMSLTLLGAFMIMLGLITALHMVLDTMHTSDEK